MQDVTFHSAALGRDMPYRAYLPERIASGERLPVVYLLHGGNGSFRDWSNESDVASYAAKGLILVMPEGAFSYYMNETEKPTEKYEDYILHDLISDVEARFPTATGRKNRAMIGVSMGGFAALSYALRRPEVFFFIGALSPPVEILHRRFNIRRWGEWWRIRTIFGPSGSGSRSARDPLELVKTANPTKTPFIYMSAGTNEPLFDPNRRFAARLKEYSFSYEFHGQPGGHDWSQWNEQLPGCFTTLMTHMAK
jgi:S-formylglutathione hydrolase FrmB